MVAVEEERRCQRLRNRRCSYRHTVETKQLVQFCYYTLRVCRIYVSLIIELPCVYENLDFFSCARFLSGELVTREHGDHCLVRYHYSCHGVESFSWCNDNIESSLVFSFQKGSEEKVEEGDL